MKKIAFLTLSLLSNYSLLAQKTINLSDLVFEKTQNKSVVYVQYIAEARLSAKTTSDQRITLDLGAGSAEIYQSKDDVLRAEAEIILSVKNDKRIEKELEDLELFIADNGNEMKLVSDFDYEQKESSVPSGFFSSPERKVNIKVYVPANLYLKVSDRSGDLSIEDIANNLKLKDTSGAIRIDGLEGNLNLTDNSGEIVIKNLNKENTEGMIVKIRDSSGGIYLSDINGETEIDDTSGEIEVVNLGGALEIDDTSGGIQAKNIGGDTRIVDTSGEITLRSISGNVTISDTSGGIYVDNVTKDVNLKRDGSGSFITKNVKGNILKRG